MSYFKKSILLCALVACIMCQLLDQSSEFVVGNGAGLFYRFNPSSRDVRCVDDSGVVVRSINLPFLPNSAALTSVSDVAVISGVQTTSATSVVATVNLASGTITKSITTTTSTKVIAVKDDYIIVANGLCYRRMCLNTLSESSRQICAPMETKLLGLINGYQAAVTTMEQTTRVGVFDIRGFIDASFSNTMKVIPGVCNGTPFLARNAHIYTSTTSGVMHKYAIASNALSVVKSINYGISGPIKVATDVCNNDHITVVGTNNDSCGVTQVSLSSFSILGTPVNFRTSILGAFNNLNWQSKLFGAVSGSSLLLGGFGNNVCAIGCNRGVVCNGVVTSSNINLSPRLKTCPLINLGMNLASC
ncbi:hypothetical protein AKO1_001640 [Acrasis kona]|uniref:Uncharacterized protein n=1 Tax=Acrasis kona TaxID=1008807 RepID=A0AAW2Z9Z4_9EUKA